MDLRIKRSSLHRLHRGVYAVGHRALAPLSRAMAAVLALGPDAVLSHRSAAWLWQLRATKPETLEVSRAKPARQRPGISCHESGVPDDEREVVEGIPVTSTSRTILDLAAVLPVRQLERAVNEMEVRRLTARLSLPDLLGRYPGRRGTAVLRTLLADRASFVGVTRNEFEERFLALVDANGLPRPRVNADLSIRGGFIQPDFVWAKERLVVETDGGAVHHTDEAFERDRERDRILIAEGWRVARVTWRHLRDSPQEVADDLRSALVLAPAAAPSSSWVRRGAASTL